MMRSEVDSVERRLNQAEKTRDASEKRTKQLEEELGQKMAGELSLGQAVKAAAEADIAAIAGERDRADEAAKNSERRLREYEQEARRKFAEQEQEIALSKRQVESLRAQAHSSSAPQVQPASSSGQADF